MFAEETLVNFLFLAIKTFVNSCLFALFMSHDNVKVWKVKFGELPVICQIYFPPPKIVLHGIPNI